MFSLQILHKSMVCVSLRELALIMEISQVDSNCYYHANMYLVILFLENLGFLSKTCAFVEVRSITKSWIKITVLTRFSQTFFGKIFFIHDIHLKIDHGKMLFRDFPIPDLFQTKSHKLSQTLFSRWIGCNFVANVNVILVKVKPNPKVMRSEWMNEWIVCYLYCGWIVSYIRQTIKFNGFNCFF